MEISCWVSLAEEPIKAGACFTHPMETITSDIRAKSIEIFMKSVD